MAASNTHPAKTRVRKASHVQRTAKQHRWAERTDGTEHCRDCAMRKHWAGAKDPCAFTAYFGPGRTTRAKNPKATAAVSTVEGDA